MIKLCDRSCIHRWINLLNTHIIQSPQIIVGDAIPRTLSSARKTRKNLKNNKTGPGCLGSDLGAEYALQGGHDGHGPAHVRPGGDCTAGALLRGQKSRPRGTTRPSRRRSRRGSSLPARCAGDVPVHRAQSAIPLLAASPTAARPALVCPTRAQPANMPSASLFVTHTTIMVSTWPTRTHPRRARHRRPSPTRASVHGGPTRRRDRHRSLAAPHGHPKRGPRRIYCRRRRIPSPRHRFCSSCDPWGQPLRKPLVERRRIVGVEVKILGAAAISCCIPAIGALDRR